MYVLKIKHKNFDGKDELNNEEYQALPHNLRQYYKKVEDEDKYEDEDENELEV